jgi:predicted esterase
MSKIVNGASLQPQSGGRPKQVILLLHGYGSSGADLISLAPHWRQTLPDALFLAPNAPQSSSMGRGYQWWPPFRLFAASISRRGRLGRSSYRGLHRSKAQAV